MRRSGGDGPGCLLFEVGCGFKEGVEGRVLLGVTATAARPKRPTCAFKNSLSTLSAQSLGGQDTSDTLKEACSNDVARNLLRLLDWTRS